MKLARRAVYVLLAAVSTPCLAQGRHVAIKNGETVELQRLWSVLECRNNLKGRPTAEILVGPPQLSLSLQDAMVVPRRSDMNCTEKVPGAILSLTANNLTEPFTGILVVRWRYERHTGTWHGSRTFTLEMVP
jgi:hypothetical protein